MNKRCEECGELMRYCFHKEKYTCSCGNEDELHQLFRKPVEQGKI